MNPIYFQENSSISNQFGRGSIELQSHLLTWGGQGCRRSQNALFYLAFHKICRGFPELKYILSNLNV